MLLQLARTLLRFFWQGLDFLITFTGGLGQQLILIFFVAVALPPIIDFIFDYGVKAFVWLLDKFR